jgi:hypothetical protein
MILELYTGLLFVNSSLTMYFCSILVGTFFCLLLFYILFWMERTLARSTTYLPTIFLLNARIFELSLCHTLGGAQKGIVWQWNAQMLFTIISGWGYVQLFAWSGTKDSILLCGQYTYCSCPAKSYIKLRPRWWVFFKWDLWQRLGFLRPFSFSVFLIFTFKS